MSPAALSESGRHQPPPGRPRLLVTRARGPATRSAFLGLPTTHRALVRWEKHVLRHLGLAGGGSLLGRPARPHRGHFSRPLDSGASLTIGSTRLDTLKKWGRPTQTASGLNVYRTTGCPHTQNPRLSGDRWQPRGRTDACQITHLVMLSARACVVGQQMASRGALGARGMLNHGLADGRVQNFQRVNLTKPPPSLAHGVR